MIEKYTKRLLKIDMKKFTLLSFLMLFQHVFIAGEEEQVSIPTNELPAHQAETACVSIVNSRMNEPKSEQEEKECDLGSHTLKADVRHLQGTGIGYTHGYTTLAGFFSSKHCYRGWSCFLDVRGHLFNNIRYAANAGLGLRYLDNSIAWGINSYYDYRNTHQFHYNQWGLGLEAIGSFWSLNFNGYLPVGKKQSRFFDREIEGTPTEPSFAFFQGNQFYITLSGTQGLVAKREFAFKGIDAKATFQVFKKNPVSIETGIGPYYYQGRYHKYAAGIEGNITIHLGDYVTLSATGSYDNLFHQRGHGSIGVSIPFGPKNFGKNCSTPQPCKIPSFFSSKLSSGANRNEIIVVDKHKKVLATPTSGPTEVAINPATGQPYFIWFVNNQSHSDGTYESPFPTLQEALAASQPNDMIYVYPGDGTAYDVGIALQDGQLLLGSGIAQNVWTTNGLISIPAQSANAPSLENSMGSTLVTLANQNTVSGFDLMILNAGNTVVGTGIDTLFFLNNQFGTSVATGMNNLVLTDCLGALTIQNNQFTMDSSDTGSVGVALSDGGSGLSTVSILNNTFTNHASRALTFNYTGSSAPTLNIAGNTFTPPAGVSGTDAIDITTSNATVLSGSISSSNLFSDYTSNVINLNWAGTGMHLFAISNNTISSDSSVLGTNGVLLNTSASGNSSLTISNNQFSNQTSNGFYCFANTNAMLDLSITSNTIVGTSAPGGNGIQVNASDAAIVTGTIANNTCQDHLAGNINGFPSGTSQLILTIANNTLIGPSTVPMGSFPNGIQFNGSNSCVMNFNINANQLTDHADHGINLFVSDTATMTATVNRNTLTVPDNLTGTGGIQFSASNSNAVLSTCEITSNICTGHTNANIQCFPNMSSLIDLTITGNTLTGPTITPGGSHPDGIQISTSDTAVVTAVINGRNRLNSHSDHGINLFTSNDSMIVATVDGNTISAPVSTSSTSAISTGGNNSSAAHISSYTMTNNICTGHNNGSIQCFPSQDTQCSLVISNNIITAATDGIAGSSPIGIQVGVNDNSTLTNATISGNVWTSPKTYDSSGNPQGLSLGGNNNSSISNASITDNRFILSLTSYQAGTSPSGIQTYLNNSATMSGLSISNNSVMFATSTYADNTGPTGISVSTQNAGTLTNVAISNNVVSFASLPAALTNFQASGMSLGGSDSSIVGTALSPAIISQNTITGVEGNAITLLNASSNDLYMNALNNSISLGTVQQNEIGIVTVPFGSGKLIATIDSNTIEGNNGGFVGIVATNQGPSCQSATISNNTVTNVHGNNPAIPIPGLGGGIGAAILSTGNLNVFILNNGVSGNTPQGIFGLDSQAFGGSGTMCINLQNNHGAGTQPPDNYVLYNPTMAPASTFLYQDAGGNTGTIIFNPSIGDFTAGTCTTCP